MVWMSGVSLDGQRKSGGTRGMPALDEPAMLDAKDFVQLIRRPLAVIGVDGEARFGLHHAPDNAQLQGTLGRGGHISWRERA
jgi:hypothetical protein